MALFLQLCSTFTNKSNTFFSIFHVFPKSSAFYDSNSSENNYGGCDFFKNFFIVNVDEFGCDGNPVVHLEVW